MRITHSSKNFYVILLKSASVRRNRNNKTTPRASARGVLYGIHKKLPGRRGSFGILEALNYIVRHSFGVGGSTNIFLMSGKCAISSGLSVPKSKYTSLSVSDALRITCAPSGPAGKVTASPACRVISLSLVRTAAVPLII